MPDARSPGRARPGLIEARSSLRRRRKSASPGRARPGLIEASAPMLRGIHSPRHLRGARAPASLKHAVIQIVLQSGRDLRGARAPASLKPDNADKLQALGEISGGRAPRPH